MAKKTKNKFIGIILTAVLLLALLPLFTAAGNPPDSVKFQVIGVPAEIPGISVQGGTVTISETDSDTNVISVLGNSLLSARSSVSYYNSDRGAYGHGYYASEEFELLPGHYYLVEFTAPSGYSTGGDLPMRWMYVEPNGYIEKYSLVNDHFSGWYSYAPEDGAGYTYFAKFTPVNYFTLLKFQEDGTNVLPGSQFSVEVLAENYLENWSFSGWYPFTTSAGNSG
ncbi:MAG: hypothetical protein LBS90_03070, partial [Oscillospiraceae bacterium]|nr:hypothetical protein [Oscillospiraceae bacterium]